MPRTSLGAAGTLARVVIAQLHAALRNRSTRLRNVRRSFKIRKAETALHVRQHQEKNWVNLQHLEHALGQPAHVGSHCELHNFMPLFEIVRQDRQDGEQRYSMAAEQMSRALQEEWV